MESRDKLISEPQSDSTQGNIHNLALAYSCHFGVAVQTGNHQLIAEALELNLEVSDTLPEIIHSQVFSEM